MAQGFIAFLWSSDLNHFAFKDVRHQKTFCTNILMSSHAWYHMMLRTGLEMGRREELGKNTFNHPIGG